MKVPDNGTDQELRDAFLNGISERRARELRVQLRQYRRNDALENQYRQPIEAWMQMRVSFDFFEFGAFLHDLGGFDFEEHEGEFTIFAADDSHGFTIQTNFVADEETMFYRCR